MVASRPRAEGESPTNRSPFTIREHAEFPDSSILDESEEHGRIGRRGNLAARFRNGRHGRDSFARGCVPQPLLDPRQRHSECSRPSGSVGCVELGSFGPSINQPRATGMPVSYLPIAICRVDKDP